MPCCSPNKRLFLRSLTVANLLSQPPVKASLRAYLAVKTTKPSVTNQLQISYKKAAYDQKVLESWYDGYNERIMQLFKDDVNFIHVNLKDHDSTERIKTFLGKERSRATLLKLNTTK